MHPTCKLDIQALPFQSHHSRSCAKSLQSRQLNEKSKQLEEQDAVLQRGTKSLACERAQLSQAQSLLESETAANRQLSSELAGESEALGKQRRGLEAREAELQDKVEACDRVLKVCLLACGSRQRQEQQTKWKSSAGIFAAMLAQIWDCL